MTTEELEVINLGTLVQYTKLPPVTYQWLDGDGVKVDMTAGSWTGQIKGEQLHAAAQPSGLFGNTPTVDSATSIITYQFDPDDTANVGRFRFSLFAGDTNTRYGVTYEYVVIPSYGSAPGN